MSEEVIGRHESGLDLVEGSNLNKGSYKCANCNRKIHCYVKVEDGEATIHKTCKSDDCECKCRTHYACKQCGYLHAYGKKCDYEEKQVVEYDPKTAALIEYINEQYNSRRTDRVILKD